MYGLYHIGTWLYGIGIRAAALLGHSKAKKLIAGRQVTKNLSAAEYPSRPLWLHVSSLGEYEQILPILRYIRSKSEVPIVLSFYSSSGYEHVNDPSLYDLKIYLPIDTPSAMRSLITRMNPRALMLTKYEIWPYLIKLLTEEERPVYLFSALCRKNQIYYKWYGRLMRKTLQMIDYIFTQDDTSQEVLSTIYPSDQISISGDMRVQSIRDQSQTSHGDERVFEFLEGQKCYIGASIYRPEVRALLASWTRREVKIILAPHIVTEDYVQTIIEQMNGVKYTRYTDPVWDKDADVLILDTIGILKHVYRYTELAYVGGGFGKGIHNIVEPAIYANKIVFGKKSEKFAEAERLCALGTALRIHAMQDIDKATATLETLELDYVARQYQTFFDEQETHSQTVYAFLSNLDLTTS